MKFHRFLTKIEQIFERGGHLAIIFGKPTYMSDIFFYNGAALSLIDCLEDLFKKKAVDRIIRIKSDFGKMVVERNYETKAITIKEDELGEFEPKTKHFSIQEITQSPLSSRNILEQINSELKEFQPKSSAVIFDNFELLSGILHPHDEETKFILNNSLLVWKDQKSHYSIIILRTSNIESLRNLGLDDDLFIEVFQPTHQEIAYFLVKEAFKKDKILLFPLLHSNKYLEQKTTLEKAIEDFSKKLETIKDYEVSILDQSETERWSWNKLKLNSGTKEKIKQIFEGFLERKLKINGIILYGPPGTGKTTVAKILADEGGIYFKKTSSSDFKGEFLGHSAHMTRRIFEELRSLKPAVLLIDEADSILMSRKRAGGRMSSDTYVMEVVNEFLANVDGLKDEGGIFIVISTNNPELLDEAIRSRFEAIEIPLPDVPTLRELISEYMGDEYIELAELMEGYSGRDIKKLSEKLKQQPISIEQIKQEIVGKKVEKLREIFEELDLFPPIPPRAKFSDVYGYGSVKDTLINSYKSGKRKFAILGARKIGKTLLSEAFANYCESLLIFIEKEKVSKFNQLLKNKHINLTKYLKHIKVMCVIELSEENLDEFLSMINLCNDFIVVVNSYFSDEIKDSLDEKDFEIIELEIDLELISDLINSEFPHLKDKVDYNQILEDVKLKGFPLIKRYIKKLMERYYEI